MKQHEIGRVAGDGTKCCRLPVRMTEAQRDRLHEAGLRQGMSAAGLVRSRLVDIITEWDVQRQTPKLESEQK